ncbi:MAG: hypothetical protein EXX96DRAFT_615752 [Benjaminiella poitrasii]|nr:MAG: hypothetical protein EXX96DRAFT_615752 [Benjaminiella poitrasii]
MSSEAPVNAGHRFANAAEEYEEQEDWEKAAEAHSKAAEQFEKAMNDTADAEATRTLLLLSSNHKRKFNELNRKVQRILKSAAAAAAANEGNSQQKIKPSNEVGLKNALQLAQQPKKGSLNNSNGHMVSRLAGYYREDRISEIGESYALLSNEDQDDDPFNKFLEAVEGLVQQLFNPAVAFTSAPLNENDNPIPTLPEEVDTTIATRDGNDHVMLNMADSYFLVPDPNDATHQGLSSVVSKSENSSSPQRDQYDLENERLRIQVVHLRKRLKALELSAEENNMLKSSVLQFRNDVHKQAKRIMQSHHESSMRSSAAALLVEGDMNTIHNSVRYNHHFPALTNGGGGIGGYDLTSKLKELEEENKQLKIQNEKQKVLMNRYKERWEMLKENAKKRRSTTTNHSSVIPEEAEN